MSFTEGLFLDAEGHRLTQIPYDWGLSVLFRDFNGDGLPDLYVCNDLQSPDRFWQNMGNGTFRAFGANALRKTSWFSMGADVADINRDGIQDFIVLDMLSRDHRKRLVQENSARPASRKRNRFGETPQTARSTLFLGRGQGEWTEMAWFAGLAATDWSWSPVFMDVDLDGYEDLLITTGFERDVQDMDVADEIETERQLHKLSDAESLQLRRRFPSLAQPNLAFRNRGDLTFENVSQSWGFDLQGVSQGIALADLDQDGDLDVVINNLNAPATLLRNNASAARILIRTQGRQPNSKGIGARVRLSSPTLTQGQEIVAGGRYLSSDEPSRTFAALPGPLTLEVTFRSGAQVLLHEVQPNFAYTVMEPEQTAPKNDSPAKLSAPAAQWFEDWTDRVDLRHQESPYDELERQPLLPEPLSQLGPGLLWYDLDRDGWSDLVVGGSRGGTLAFLKNERGRSFTPAFPSLRGRLPDDSGSLIATLDGAGGSTNPILLRTSIANYERADQGPSLVLTFGITNSVGTVAAYRSSPLLCSNASVSCLAQADVDGDGVLDLFAGGRVIRGKFPLAAPSFLYRAREGQLSRDPATPAAFTSLGLVTSAVFCRLDPGQATPTLIIAREWDSPSLWKFESGSWTDTTTNWGLTHYRGCWNSVAVGDFNEDGLPDIVLGNMGRNQRTSSRQAELVHGDFDDNGSYDVLLTYSPSQGPQVPLDSFDQVADALPFLKATFPHRRDYAAASLAQILGDAFSKASFLMVDTYESMIFLNEGKKFRAIPLPVQAQLSPVLGISVADFDGDGHQDLFLAQNRSDNGRAGDHADAGMGVMLRGDGNGHFEALPEMTTGIRIYGSQRGTAVSDFDHDGRVDLAVSQNGAALRLFRNTHASVGLRVRLVGPPNNVDGVGALFRAVYASKRRGPWYGIYHGAGYLSQDDGVTVLAEREPIAVVEVSWPSLAPKVLRYERIPGVGEQTLRLNAPSP